MPTLFGRDCLQEIKPDWNLICTISKEKPSQSSYEVLQDEILFKEISLLGKELDENTGLSDTQKSLLQTSLDNLKNEMEKIIEYHTKGAVLRSRTRWYNEGEKNKILSKPGKTTL